MIVAVSFSKFNRRESKGKSIGVTQHFRNVELQMRDWVGVGDLKLDVEGVLGFQNERVHDIVLDLEVVFCRW